ncbi:hypothetical protein LZ31DRAFT_558628 [Colletotrichum somersetense]|nr:hypothetical protein LZ31DRAFT_558628 [Colletotrichum somersetense]
MISSLANWPTGYAPGTPWQPALPALPSVFPGFWGLRDTSGYIGRPGPYVRIAESSALRCPGPGRMRRHGGSSLSACTCATLAPLGLPGLPWDAIVLDTVAPLQGRSQTPG